MQSFKPGKYCIWLCNERFFTTSALVIVCCFVTSGYEASSLEMLYAEF